MGIEFTRTAGRLHFNGVFNKKKTSDGSSQTFKY